MPGQNSQPATPTEAVAALQAVLVASVAVPLLLLLGGAWVSHQAAERDAWEQVERVADTVREHAIRVFQTHELALGRIADRTRDMDWPAVRQSRDLHLLLQQIKEGSPQMASLGLIEPDRRVAINDGRGPLPLTYAAERQYLHVPRPGYDEDLFISEVVIGQYTRRPQFAVTRYKPNSERTPNGGMIFVSVGPDYFSRYYRDIVGDDALNITLARADGSILARFPEPPGPTTLPPASGFMQQLAQGREQGRFESISAVDGTDRLFAFKKLPNFPVYVSVGMQRSAIEAAWLRAMAAHLIYGVPATLALIATTLVALRRTRREHAALARARAEEVLRKQAEEETRQAQKMESIGRLTGGVAHDFNNLLTVIRGSAELLRTEGLSEARRRRYLDAIIETADRATNLTSHLLAFGRRQPLKPEAVDLNLRLDAFVEMVSRTIGSQIEIAVPLPGTLSASMWPRCACTIW